MAYPKTTLLNYANTIRSAKTEGFNTAERVGKMFVDIINETDTAVSDETTARQQVVTSLQTSILTAQQKADNAQTTANEAKGQITQTRIELINEISVVRGDIDMFKATKGAANGIAPLDANGKIPTRHIPGSYNDVVEFAECVSGVTVQAVSVSKSASDVNCSVVYNTDTNRFVMRVLNLQVPPATPTDLQPTLVGKYSYYNNWNDASTWGTNALGGIIPDGDKVYVATATNKTYRWSGSQLVVIGSDLALGHTAETAFPGDEGKALQDLTEPWKADIPEALGGSIGTISVNDLNNWASTGDDEAKHTGMTQMHGLDDPEELLGGKQRHIYVVTNLGCTCGLLHIYSDSMGHGLYEVLQTSNWVNARSVEISHTDGELHTYYRYLPLTLAQGGMTIGVWTDWKELGGGNAAIGNTYNVTIEQPKAVGYYTLEEAISATQNAKVEALGMSITFAIARGSWKTYQYVGESVEATDFSNTANWIDLAGMSAGSEAVVNIDSLVPRNVAGYYTKDTAIDALLNLTASTAIDYAKLGLVITFRSGERTWETYQFVGSAVSDFSEKSLWLAFGNDGNDLEASDTPAKNGTDAFSTGGAYSRLPVESRVTQEEGKVSIELLNADGDGIMAPIEFLASQGGGGQESGTIVSITPEHSPLYAKAGGEVVLRCAVRSVTMSGTQEHANTIEKVELYDRDSGSLLATYKLNQASSADAQTYDFVFDVSKYFTQAAGRKFKLVAYDDTDHTGQRFVNVTAVDVTIKSEQTLHYTATTALAKGGAAKTMPMYRFPNNASANGILCTVEIYIDGQWKTLGTKTVTDTFSNSITINPQDCCVTVLGHGAYSLRIHGEDTTAGVVGNYLHTQVMVVDPADTRPIVVSRYYTEKPEGTIKALETLSIDFAAYSTEALTLPVEVKVNGVVKQTTEAARNTAYTYTQRVKDVATDGSATLSVVVSANGQQSQTATYKVVGSLLDIQSVTSMLSFDIDMAGRSNSDADKTICDNGHTLSVSGANYTSNGFVKDSYGSPTYGTPADTGEMALRIAENVTASLDYAPFDNAGIETNGMAIQFRVRAKHVADDTARLISCVSNGVGFWMTGKEVVFTTDNAATVAHTIRAAIKDDSTTDVCIVIEPTSQAPYAGIGVAKMYFDGELIGACYYETGGISRHNTPVTFDGTHGDLYLYNIRAWETYFTFAEDFQNYLLKMHDTDAMIEEYAFNQVMASQSAEGKPATERPQMSLLAERGMPYCVMCKNAATADTPDNYPEYLETLDGDKKTARVLDWYVYFPDEPWRNVIIEGAPTTNQGTTSSWRPIKNKKIKLKACAGVRMMYPRTDFTDAAQLAEYDFLAAQAAKKKIQLWHDSLPTNIITIKVDYSESGGANNGASTQLFNELQLGLGDDYITPAQKAYKAAGGEYTLNSSIDSVPCALFRTDANSPDATSPSYGYFHAKGNLNQDKGDAALYGFQKCKGYNEHCLNYGDFTELIAARGQSLDAFAAAVDKSEWSADKVYVLSEFCGPGHKVYRNIEGVWTETAGTMRFVNGRWSVSGDVVNPVENYELLAYNDMDWFQNVSTIDDMLRRDDNGNLVWLQQFESRYPDDDDLNQAYEDGRKLPYRLFKWLQWCNDCNQHKTEADGDITLDGATVSGTQANRLLKFKHELHKVANVHSMICYHVFTDYIAAVDQRSKNMMLGFYLEADGSVRAYLNHLYDGDTILGSDNDCGLTIPALLDPNNDPQGFYQGHDSVLFTQLAKSDYLWLTDYASESDTTDSTKTVTVANVANVMRSKTLGSGLRPFSPQGLEKYWVTDRLSRWPKLVSSYDGVRKYLDASTATANYFYALHGLSIQRLQDFIKTRFRYRDGFYRCGDTYTSALKMRCTGTDMSVTVTAAKDGFFGLGVDRASEANGGSAYLQAGETHTFESHNTNLGSGVMLYVYGADRIGALDIRNATPKQSGWDISEGVLLEKLIMGGENYTPATNNGDELATLNLGQLPFLRELDVRGFPVTNIDASKCPRLEKVLAGGSKLTTISLAETSPLSVLQLTGTMTELSLVNLPNLTYPGGLTIGSMANVRKLMLGGCPNIDPQTLLEGVVGSGNIRQIRLPDVNITEPSSILAALKSSGAIGLDPNGQAYDESGRCSGIVGRWIFSDLVSDTALADYAAYFPQLNIYNSQFSSVRFSDTEDDTENISNDSNRTGYLYGNDFVPSDHFLRVQAMSHAYKCTFNTVDSKMHCVQLSDDDYGHLADGSEFDPSDMSGTGFDIMKLIPDYWYKGVNDFKNQEKHFFVSSNAPTAQPMSTANRTVRRTLAECKVQDNAAIITSGLQAGDTYAATPNSNMNLYAIDVEGMKQVRWPGLNDATVGAVFVDADDKVVSTFNMAVAHSLFDFVLGDYIFCDVPKGAKRLVFTSPVGFDELEAIAVDSAAVEAIEPDWVRHHADLVGVYGMSVDGLTRARSISGAKTRTGTGTSTTCVDWTYDRDGNLTNITVPTSLANYTYMDLFNVCKMRGPGFHAISYEQSKDIANLVMALVGDRDIQAVCGYGCSAGYTTGSNSLNTFGNTTRRYNGSNIGNVIFGLQNFVGCNWEIMDYVALNIASWATWKRNKYLGVGSDPTNAKWHIYDHYTGTERVVQGLNQSDKCIGRVKFGRYCDTIASRLTNDNSAWNRNYADANYYSNSTGRCVGRSSYSANAYGGLVCAYAHGASSNSSTSSGSRLAFSGEIVIDE